MADLPDEPDGVSDDDDADVEAGNTSRGFLDPFVPKADTEYIVEILGGRRRRTRNHEKLVNECADWLLAQGLEPGRNAAVDLGTQDPPVVIEAKMVGSWAGAVRQAVGQLYEYRYFKVAEPSSGLVFLASKPVPLEWQRYLETDRGIGCMWPDGAGYYLSKLAKNRLGL